MGGDGDSKKPKDDVLASIRKIMLGGKADLGEVPAPGSKASGAPSEPEDDWSLPPGSLSEAEGGAPVENPIPAPPAAEPLAAAPDDDDDDDDDDDVLPLSAAMQVAPADGGAEADDDDDDALDLSAIPAEADADRPMVEDDVEVIREDSGTGMIPDWEPAPARDEDVSGSAEDTVDTSESGDDSGADPFASLRRRWDWPDEQTADAAGDTGSDEGGEVEAAEPAAAPEEDWDETPEAAVALGAAVAEAQDDGADWSAEPALTLGEIEDTIRRVVREELEGETGQRLSQNIRRLVLNEIARAMQRTD